LIKALSLGAGSSKNLVDKNCTCYTSWLHLAVRLCIEKCNIIANVESTDLDTMRGSILRLDHIYCSFEIDQISRVILDDNKDFSVFLVLDHVLQSPFHLL
jgi:hypothetical protein